MLKKILDKLVNALGGMSERTLLLVLAIIIGTGCGLAAVILKKLVLGITMLSESLIGALGAWLYVILPGIGMLLSFLLVKFIIKDNIGHGVTKVLLAISRNDSRIKEHNMWSSVLTSSLTIGFGGSVGAEAPIVYTGAAIGSNVARMLHLPYKQMTLSLGCGAAAAVAAIFKAPLAGILFTLEVLLLNLSSTSIFPLLISSVTATIVSYLFMGTDPFFPGTFTEFSMSNIPFYILLGLFCGVISIYFIQSTLFLEDKIGKYNNPIKKWGFCALMLGVLIFIFPHLYGEGYESMSQLLNGKDPDIAGGLFSGIIGDNKWIILAYFCAVMLLKVFATAFTNAGGGVGGTFGPTLITGAFAGFFIARLVNNFSFISLPEANFVLVGMAGLMAGVMQAPMTAIFLIAEITGGYTLLLPLIITSVISFGATRSVEKFSIYSKRLAASGDLLTHDSDQAVLTLLKTSDLIETNFITVRPDQTLRDLVKVVAKSNRNIFPVVNSENVFQGIVLLDDIRECMFDVSQYDSVHIYTFMTQPPKTVLDTEKMDSVMFKFEQSEAWSLPVLDRDKKYLGFVSKSKIFSAYREQLQQVSNE